MSRQATNQPEPEPEYSYNEGFNNYEPGSPVDAEENIESLQTEPEEMPDLDDLAQEPSQGAWPAGWYKAEVLEGFATSRGNQVFTGDAVSQKGDSHNITIALKVFKGEDTRNMRASFNYRVDDFDAQVIEGVKEARKEYAGVKGKWPGDASDLQRSSLALAKIGQFQKAIGFKFKRNSEGALVPGVFVGQVLDVRLRTNEDGFNEIVEYAKAGERTSGGQRRRRSS